MKYKITTLSNLSLCIVLFASIFSGATVNSPSTKAIAQIAQAQETKEDKLAKAGEATIGMFDALIAGEFEQARGYLSPSIKEYTTAAQIEQQWQKILDNMGAFVEYKKIRPTTVFDDYTVLVSARFESIITDFAVTLDSERQITSVDFLWIGNIQENAENFVDALADGNYATARSLFAPKLKENFLPEDLEQGWQEVLAEAGSFKGRSESKRVESSGSDLVLVNLEFERENRSLMIIFNPLKQIVGVDFPEEEE